MLKKILIYLITPLLSLGYLHAQGGYEIKVKLSNYNQPQLVLGFQLGDKSYIKDSTLVGADGWFTFKNKETALDPGVYIILMKPENQYFQILVDSDDQHFSIEADAKEPLKT